MSDGDTNLDTPIDGDNANSPQDKYYVAFFCCLMLGVVQLYPWNILVSINGWFVDKFNPFPFMFTMSIMFNWPNVIMLVVQTKWGHLVSEKVKVYVSFFSIFALLMMIPLINQFELDLNLRVGLSLFFVFLIGMCIATLIGTGFGLVAPLPPVYITALMTGQGLAGIAAGALQLVFNFAIWPLPSNPNISLPSRILNEQGWYYYSISAGVVLFCAVCTAYLLTLPFYKFYQRKANQKQNVNTGSLNEESVKLTNDDFIGGDSEKEFTGQVSVVTVFSKLWMEGVTCFLTFFITLALFPGFTLMVVSTGVANIGTILICLFQLGDFVGRSLPVAKALVPPLWMSKYFCMAGLLRFAFFPLIIFNVPFPPSTTAYFTADWIPFVVMIIFSISNGYISTLTMIWGPQRLEPHEKQVGGTMMTLFLQMGILAGVHSALLLKYLVTGKVIN